jgi:hypothetical protein
VAKTAVVNFDAMHAATVDANFDATLKRQTPPTFGPINMHVTGVIGWLVNASRKNRQWNDQYSADAPRKM